MAKKTKKAKQVDPVGGYLVEDKDLFGQVSYSYITEQEFESGLVVKDNDRVFPVSVHAPLRARVSIVLQEEVPF